MSDDAPPDEVPTPVKLLTAIDAELKTIRRHLLRAEAAVECLAGIVEPIAIANDLATGYPWPKGLAALGIRARQIREEAGLTRLQLAVLTGLADSTIRNFETGRHEPTEVTRRKLLPRLEALAHTPRTPTGKDPKRP